MLDLSLFHLLSLFFIVLPQPLLRLLIIVHILLLFVDLYLTVILRGRAGYELIHITNEAVGRVGYYQLISGKSEKNNCFSKFSSNSLDFFG